MIGLLVTSTKSAGSGTSGSTTPQFGRVGTCTFCHPLLLPWRRRTLENRPVRSVTKLVT